ncbi:MAG: hypothetical protein PHH85_12210 [Candidatus Methanoperedens sp.]|nr:hypothetical protein [Candidatus Methanoperedens sp.]
MFIIAAAVELRGEARAFRSLDAGAEMHGGVLSRWGAGVCVFMRGCFVRVRTVVLVFVNKGGDTKPV